ncbi:MAG: hypothetical protein U1C66_02065, partial [Patescibacteria group bacterium]|nr:hypothetical protein [Patescibacteria group bacterium]
PKTAIDMVFFSGRWIPALSLGYIAWKLVSPSGEAAKTPEELSAARFFLLLIGILSAYEALRLYKKSR